MMSDEDIKEFHNLDKLKGMKKAGCSKPAFVNQSNWDRV